MKRLASDPGLRRVKLSQLFRTPDWSVDWHKGKPNVGYSEKETPI